MRPGDLYFLDALRLILMHCESLRTTGINEASDPDINILVVNSGTTQKGCGGNAGLPPQRHNGTLELAQSNRLHKISPLHPLHLLPGCG